MYRKSSAQLAISTKVICFVGDAVEVGVNEITDPEVEVNADAALVVELDAVETNGAGSFTRIWFTRYRVSGRRYCIATDATVAWPGIVKKCAISIRNAGQCVGEEWTIPRGPQAFAPTANQENATPATPNLSIC